MTNSDTTTKLLRAAERSKLDTVIRSLKAGADVNAIGRLGWSALHWAVMNNDREMTSLLLDHGANIDMINQSSTPLMLSVINSFIPVMTLLLERGANSELKNRDDRRAIDLCTGTDEHKIRQILHADMARKAMRSALKNAHGNPGLQ